MTESLTFDYVLNNIFKFPSLRSFQKNVVTSMLDQKDILVISPTGSGKSLCFQLPSLVSEGICIVISPLRSLIYDQVVALKLKGISCELLNGDLGVRKKNKLFTELKNKVPAIKLLYTTPETLICNDETKLIMLDLYRRNLINRIVLDEAHCISTWGHDFRPNYLKVRKLKELYPNIPIAALTATATEKVNADIRDILQFDENTQIFQSSFIRTNLNIIIKSRGSKKVEEKECLSEIGELLLTKYKGQSAILYAFSRNKCEELASSLQELDIKADFYHAGMSAKNRNETQNAWINNDIQIICATIAFGMGIDKADVRVVFHYNLPKTIEGYYQEIGRGGRDGIRSDCIFYYSEHDRIIYRQMADKKRGEIDSDDYFREKKQQMIRAEQQKMYDMIGFIENESECRHILLSNYFGEKRKEKIGFCNDLCDNCLKFKRSGGNIKKENITEDVRTIMELIGTLREPYKETIVTKLVGYPKKIPKRKLKKEISGGKAGWDKYKEEYDLKKNKIIESNSSFNVREKKIKRILNKLVVEKYLDIEIIKLGKGFNCLWKEKYSIFKKAKKVLDGKKTIKM